MNRKAVAVGVASALTLGMLGLTTSPARAASAPAPVAHRGGTEGAVENTRNAWNYSMRHGVRWIETDIRFTKDDVPVIMHDDTISRVTNYSGTKSVSSMTLAELRSYRTADGQYIPTMYELMRDGGRYGAHYFMELKVQPTAVQWSRFNARFAWLGQKGNTVVTSFDKGRLLDAKARGYATGWIDELGDRDPAQVKPYGDYYLKHYWSVTWSRMQKWNAAGLKVFAWTPDNPRDWQRMKWDHVAGVVTNKPVAYG